MTDGPTSPRATRTGIRVRTWDGFMACTTAGSGEPVLLVHGLGGDRRTWDELLDDLARHHTVIAPDLPGHGESDAPAGEYSLGAHATALRDLLTALGHRAATLPGAGAVVAVLAHLPPVLTRLLLPIAARMPGLVSRRVPDVRAVELPLASHRSAAVSDASQGWHGS